MSDCGSCGTCGSCGSCNCDCNCFGHSDGCCDNVGDGPNETYEPTTTADVVADCVEAAMDIVDAGYAPVATNANKKNPQDADAHADNCSNTCIWVSVVTGLFSVSSIMGK